MMEKQKHLFRGEVALPAAVMINSLGVILMLYSNAGISAISSVPYAFSEVFTFLSLGTWTYIFQGLLVLSLMILRRKFVPSYLFSFVVGFVFGELLDLHRMWVGVLPRQPALAHCVVPAELCAYQYRNCDLQPLRTADSPDGPFPQGIVRHNPSRLSPDKDHIRRQLPCSDRRPDILRTRTHRRSGNRHHRRGIHHGQGSWYLRKLHRPSLPVRNLPLPSESLCRMTITSVCAT